MRRVIITTALIAVPRAALACPVCFGQNDSPMTNAMNMGIMAMLAVIVAVLGGFATFIIYLVRRGATALDPTTAVAGRTPLALPGADPQEGTAQC
jgi:hypothetical protein